jgi:chromosome partitioning protein
VASSPEPDPTHDPAQAPSRLETGPTPSTPDSAGGSAGSPDLIIGSRTPTPVSAAIVPSTEPGGAAPAIVTSTEPGPAEPGPAAPAAIPDSVRPGPPAGTLGEANLPPPASTLGNLPPPDATRHEPGVSPAAVAPPEAVGSAESAAATLPDTALPGTTSEASAEIAPPAATNSPPPPTSDDAAPLSADSWRGAAPLSADSSPLGSEQPGSAPSPQAGPAGTPTGEGREDPPPGLGGPPLGAAPPAPATVPADAPAAGSSIEGPSGRSEGRPEPTSTGNGHSVPPPEPRAPLTATGERRHPAAVAHRLPRWFAIANQKGGVGKTTTAVNLGAALAELDYRVLVVDLDPQGNATTGLGINARNLDASIYDVILHDVPIEDVIEPTTLRNLFAVPATIDLAGAEIELVPVFSRELRLRRALETIEADFDYVLIDCPPSLGLLTVNGLAAAGEVIVPIQCEYYALEGLGQLLRNVGLVQANLNQNLEVSTIILTMYDARTRLAEQVVEEVRQHFGDRVCRNVVPRTVRLSEAPSFGQPIVVFDSSSRGAIAYRELAKEVSGGAPQRVR